VVHVVVTDVLRLHLCQPLLLLLQQCAGMAAAAVLTAGRQA
jgi:hypothetical protein